jgi:GTP cyclohydrolase I
VGNRSKAAWASPGGIRQRVEPNNKDARNTMGQRAWPVKEYISEHRRIFTVPPSDIEDVFRRLAITQATYARVIRWISEYTGTPYEPPQDLLTTFPTKDDTLIMVKDMRLVALCEHHLLPFHGRAAIGYIPDGHIVGLSKLKRLLDWYCTWPTLQEHITDKAADYLMERLQPKGVMVVLKDVEHSCMSMRGVKDAEANTTTSAVRGIFKDSANARGEFLQLL